jgi:hypothetical protein
MLVAFLKLRTRKSFCFTEPRRTTFWDIIICGQWLCFCWGQGGNFAASRRGRRSTHYFNKNKMLSVPVWANKSTLIREIEKILYLLCIGTTTPLSDYAPLFSLDKEPWLTLPKSTFHPKNNDFVREIVRRAKVFKLDWLPRPTNWNRVQIIEWLEQYPITCGDDIRFLMGEVLRERDTFCWGSSKMNYRSKCFTWVFLVVGIALQLEEATGAVAYLTCGSYCA